MSNVKTLLYSIMNCIISLKYTLFKHTYVLNKDS